MLNIINLVKLGSLVVLGIFCFTLESHAMLGKGSKGLSSRARNGDSSSSSSIRKPLRIGAGTSSSSSSTERDLLDEDLAGDQEWARGISTFSSKEGLSGEQKRDISKAAQGQLSLDPLSWVESFWILVTDVRQYGPLSQPKSDRPKKAGLDQWIQMQRSKLEALEKLTPEERAQVPAEQSLTSLQIVLLSKFGIVATKDAATSAGGSDENADMARSRSWAEAFWIEVEHLKKNGCLAMSTPTPFTTQGATMPWLELQKNLFKTMQRLNSEEVALLPESRKLTEFQLELLEQIPEIEAYLQY